MTRTWNPWTQREQSISEVAAASGVSLRQIAAVLGRDGSIVRRHLKPDAAQAARDSANEQRIKHPERHRAGVLKWQRDNPEAVRRWYYNYYRRNRTRLVQAQRDRRARIRAQKQQPPPA